MPGVTFLTNASSEFLGSAYSGSFAGTNGAITGGSITVNSNGVSVNLPAYLTTAQPVGAYLTTAMQSNAATISNINISAGTTSNNLSALTFANSNGISFGLNGSVITGTVATNYQSAGAYLTTAMASNRGSDFVQANAAFAGTNASGTIASNGISISVAAPGAGGGIGIAAGTRTATTANTLLFDNANGITFGLNAVGGSIMTASHNALTTARASTDAIGLNSALTANGVSMTANSSGLSLNFPAFLTTAMQSASSSVFAKTGFTTATTAGSVLVGTHNTDGLSLGVPQWLTTAQPVGAYLTTARASNDAVGLNTALTAGPLAWTVNSSGISLNAGSAAGTTTGFAGNLLSASMTHNTAGLNLSMNHPAWLTTAMASNRGTDFVQANAAFAGTNASGTIASNGISISVAAPGAGAAVTVSASNGSFTIGQLNFSNANNVTFGTSAGSIITASVAAPGAGAAPQVSLYPRDRDGMAYSTANSGTVGTTGGSTQHTFSGFLVSQAIPYDIHFSHICHCHSGAATVAGTGSVTVGHAIGIYTLNANTALSLVSSFQNQMYMSQSSVTARSHHFFWGTASNANSTATSGNISASFTAARQNMMYNAAGTLTAGNYYFAYIHTGRSSSSAIYNQSSVGFGTGNLTTGAAFVGESVTNRPYGWCGVFSSTINKSSIVVPIMPNSIHTSAITHTGGSTQLRVPYFIMQRSIT